MEEKAHSFLPSNATISIREQEKNVELSQSDMVLCVFYNIAFVCIVESFQNNLQNNLSSFIFTRRSFSWIHVLCLVALAVQCICPYTCLRRIELMHHYRILCVAQQATHTSQLNYVSYKNNQKNYSRIRRNER